MSLAAAAGACAAEEQTASERESRPPRHAPGKPHRPLSRLCVCVCVCVCGSGVCVAGTGVRARVRVARAQERECLETQSIGVNSTTGDLLAVSCMN